ALCPRPEPIPRHYPKTRKRRRDGGPIVSRSVREDVVEDYAVGALVSAGSEIRQGAELAEAGLSLTSGMINAILRDLLERLNPQLSYDEREQVLRVLLRPPHLSLVENNRWFHGLLTDGVPIEYKDATTGEM